jgi:two-component system, sensor histidine kinase and response regulator
MARVLIVDDDVESLLMLKLVLTRNGHEVKPLNRATNLHEEIEKAKPDLLILDMMMPGVMGGMAYDMVRSEIGPTLPVIISTGTSMKVRGTGDPLLRYCPKPVETKLLLDTIKELMALAEESELDEPGRNSA